MRISKGKVLKATLEILRNYPDTRSNEGLLVSKVIESFNPSTKGLKFNFVVEHREDLGLPSFESITRARRKAQRTYPELRAIKVVEDARAEEEKEYREWAKIS